jgi:hypothetical protein
MRPAAIPGNSVQKQPKESLSYRIGIMFRRISDTLEMINTRLIGVSMFLSCFQRIDGIDVTQLSKF